MLIEKNILKKKEKIQNRCLQLPLDTFLGIFALNKSLHVVIANMIQKNLNVS